MVALGGAALALALAAPGSGSAGAQILGTTTEAPATTAPPTVTTAPPPVVTEPPTSEAPTTVTPTTAPPTIPVTTVPVDGRARITQDTPDLGGVLALWGVGILGTVATLAWSWNRNRS